MPPKSKRQARLMRAACGDKAVAKRVGISQEKACEIVKGHPTKRLPERARRRR